MATIALTAAAAAFSATATGAATVAFGITAGAAAMAAATTVGGFIDNALFGPSVPDIEGPRLEDASVAIASEGQFVPRVYGTVRTACPRIWMTNFREVPTTDKVGGKGGALGGGQSQTTYEYYCSFAVIICEGIIEEVLTIYADGQEMDLDLVSGYTVYDGTQSAADPTIVATEGASPTYRGLSYIVFEDVPLSSYSNRVPSIAVVVRRNTGLTVRGALDAIAGDAGLTIDAEAAPETPLRGFTVNSKMSPRAAIGGVASSYNLDVGITDDGAVKIVPRYGTSVAEILEADLVADGGSGGAVVYTRARPDDAPAEVTLSYPDLDRDYQAGSVVERRSAAPGGGISSKQLTIVLTRGEAQALAISALEDAWRRRETVSGVLSPEIARQRRLGDFVDLVTDSGHRYTLRIDRLAAEWTGPFEGRVVSSTPADAGGISDSAALAAFYEDAAPVNIVFLDLPVLLGSELEYAPHVAAWGDAWRGAALYRSPTGDDFELTGGLEYQATTGVTGGALGAGPEWDVDGIPDTATLSIVLDNGTLVSATSAQLDVRANVLAVQAVTGDWEILQFGTATLTGPGTYDLTGLRRALRGTDGQMIHAAGARAVLLNSAVRQVDYPREERDQSATYRYGPKTRSVDDPLYAQVDRSFIGEGLRPYSPVSLTAERDLVSGTITLGWTRRDRKDFDPVETPMSEESEHYEVDIFNGGIFFGTLTADENTLEYDSVTQAAHGFDGSETEITFAVFQISAAVGRGTGRAATLTIPSSG